MMDGNNVEFSTALVSLLKGVVNRDDHIKQWNTITIHAAQIDDYFAQIGLVMVLDQTDGYAYLKQLDLNGNDVDIPRLIPRHQLNYMTSILLVLLRKQLIDFDQHSSEGRFIISKQDIVEKLSPFLKETTNEAKQFKDIEASIKRIESMGLIRSLKDSNSKFEILRIIRGFVDAQCLEKIDERLEEYRNYCLGDYKEEEDESL